MKKFYITLIFLLYPMYSHTMQIAALLRHVQRGLALRAASPRSRGLVNYSYAAQVSVKEREEWRFTREEEYEEAVRDRTGQEGVEFDHENRRIIKQSTSTSWTWK